jgi:predicted ATPase
LTGAEGATAARLVTLTGFGGMGKSRVARQTADACADEFEGGVWWVALDEARTGDEMLATPPRGCACRSSRPCRCRDQVHGFLRDRSRLLLVLDNTEQVEEAATVVRDLLAQAPGLSCLVTSRRALGLRAETLVEIRPLPPLDAQRLFADRARAAATTSVSRRERRRRGRTVPPAGGRAARHRVGRRAHHRHESAADDCPPFRAVPPAAKPRARPAAPPARAPGRH